MSKPQKYAFILIGGISPISRRSAFLAALQERELEILVIDDPENEHLLRCAQAEGKMEAAKLPAIADALIVQPEQIDDMLLKVSEWRKNYCIQGLFCLHEPMVESASVIADYLGVPHPGLRAGRVTRNKALQRMWFPRWSPRWLLAAPSKVEPAAIIDQVPFPLVIKPLNQHSSRDVVRVDNAQALSNVLTHHDHYSRLLFEQIVVGQEVSVETLIQRRRVIFNSITRKRTNEKQSQYFVEMGHQVPALLCDLQEHAILEVNNQILSKIGFEDGIAHGEYRITLDGDVMLMEIAARSPGCSILELYYLATGSRMEDTIIDIALGRQGHYPKPTRVARQVYLEHEECTLADVAIEFAEDVDIAWLTCGAYHPPRQIDADEKAAKVRQVQILKRRGDALGPIKSSSDRAVTFLMDGPTVEDLDRLERTARTAIRLIMI